MSFAIPLTSDTVTKTTVYVRDHKRAMSVKQEQDKQTKQIEQMKHVVNTVSQQTSYVVAQLPIESFDLDTDAQPVQVIDLTKDRKVKRRVARFYAKFGLKMSQKARAGLRKAIPTLPFLPVLSMGVMGAVPVAAHGVPDAPMTPVTADPSSATVPAVSQATMHDKMMDAFMPIIELVQALAYPVALLVVLGGGLFVMIGNTEKGFALIQRAALGYVLVMMLPMLLDVLVDAMSSVV